MKCATRHMPLAVPLRLQAVHEDYFEKSRQGGHLMVPSCSAALSSMYSTTLVAVGRHPSVRSSEATPLHVGLAAHAFPSWSCWPRLDRVSHVPYAPHVNRLTCVSVVGHNNTL